MDSPSKPGDVEGVVAGCYEVIDRLKKCVDETPWAQRYMLGACSDLNREVDRCRTKVWKAHQAANYEKSREMKRKRLEKVQSAEQSA